MPCTVCLLITTWPHYNYIELRKNEDTIRLFSHSSLLVDA